LSCFVSRNREREFERIKKSVSKELEICGFIDIKDVANPCHISRHLVLPLPVSSSPAKSEGHGVAGNHIFLTAHFFVLSVEVWIGSNALVSVNIVMHCKLVSEMSSPYLWLACSQVIQVIYFECCCVHG